jgi:integrase
MPTFREYVSQVSDAIPIGTRRTYQTYWQRIIDAWGDRHLDEPAPLEIKKLCESAQACVVARKNSRGGRSATEHLIAALRFIYRYATADGLVADADNPAIRVPKPRRLPGTRRAIPDHRLAEIIKVAGTTGNGALQLRPSDLDTEQCLILLREKGGTTRWQPVSPTLMHHLMMHDEERGTGSDEQLKPASRRMAAMMCWYRAVAV